MAAMFLRQSTASQSRALGPFVSDTDFKTVQTGLTIANTDIKLVVNGAASANKNSGGGTHRVNGVYGVTFDATDTATVGEMEVSVNVAGALVVFDKFFVVEEAVYDMLYAASALGYVANAPVNAAQVGGQTASAAGAVTFPGTIASTTNITAGTITTATNVTTVNGLANNVITAASINADAITDAKVAADVTIASVTGAVGSVTGAVGSVTGAVGSVTAAVTVGTNNDKTGYALTAAYDAAKTAATQASVDTIDNNVDAILVDTAEIGAAGAGLTVLATAAALATVDTVVDAVKAKTDSLTFTTAGEVDANIQSVNDTPVTGNGQPGTEWGPV